MTHTVIVYGALALVCLILLFLIMRAVVCWYLKINLRVRQVDGLIAKIEQTLCALDRIEKALSGDQPKEE